MSRPPRKQPDWARLVYALGFDDEHAMWRSLSARFSGRQLALRLGVPLSVIRSRLRSLGLVGVPRMTAEEARAAKEVGVGPTARRLHLPYHTVYHMIHRALRRANRSTCK